ncbi:hypothetical protein MAR_010199 [Mya arenaria]|uniref:Uncharacterized protein n=1 Tax=Mya arenaria TaxID=6604 RepID=A0ABY7E906_MYAAR|nr:hypothetical protein MAR_010199 [Mya arenaria]
MILNVCRNSDDLTALAMSECHREGPYVFSCEWPYWCCQDGISGISLYAYFGITLGFIGFLVLFGVALNIGLTRCRQPQFSVMPCVAVTKSSRSLYPKFQKGKTPNILQRLYKSLNTTLSEGIEAQSEDKKALSEGMGAQSEDKKALSEGKEASAEGKGVLSEGKKALSEGMEALPQVKEALSEGMEA